MTERELLCNGLQELSVSFDEQTIEQLLFFSTWLRERNQVMNLTAITDPLEIITRHFLDCAVLVPYLKSGEKVLDIGTGAGFPGLPLAILCPDTSFVLLDAQQKRINFLQEVIKTLHLSNCTAIQARAEEYTRDNRDMFQKIVSRAVAALRILCEMALPALEVNGQFYAMKAADCTEEIQQAAQTISVLGGGTAQIFPYTAPLTEIKRALIQVSKEQKTPICYPRRYKKIISCPL